MLDRMSDLNECSLNTHFNGPLYGGVCLCLISDLGILSNNEYSVSTEQFLRLFSVICSYE